MQDITDKFMKFSSEVTLRLKERIKENEGKPRKIEKITRYPDTKNLKPLNDHKFSETIIKEVYTPPVTYPDEVEEIIRTPIEVEPLNETKLKEVGLNCNHNTLLSSREVPSFDRSEPQPLLNNPSLDVSLGDVIGLEPPINPHRSDSSRMKVVDYLTTQTPPSPYVENSYPKGVYSYYNPGIDDPKRHYGFKPGLLEKNVSLGVDISNWEMFDVDWGLESKKVSLLGEEISVFDRPNEVERGRILEAHRSESILQQQISQHETLSHNNGVYRYYHPHLNSSVREPSPLSVK
uniref:Uncharacterized protein n=1 Tax=Tanacetum cinerariifolium TaxID=118510 RepID=A0A6L2LZ38_TANCI|nr:hypothetical protein [Tanacetum cinerariifolium]